MIRSAWTAPGRTRKTRVLRVNRTRRRGCVVIYGVTRGNRRCLCFFFRTIRITESEWLSSSAGSCNVWTRTMRSSAIRILSYCFPSAVHSKRLRRVFRVTMKTFDSKRHGETWRYCLLRITLVHMWNLRGRLGGLSPSKISILSVIFIWICKASQKLKFCPCFGFSRRYSAVRNTISVSENCHETVCLL